MSLREILGPHCYAKCNSSHATWLCQNRMDINFDPQPLDDVFSLDP